MKHTKHALTYLRRQYSAVLKHAYALGIATVIVLSLGSATANTATASTKVTDQQTANDLLNNWKSEYQIQIDSKPVMFLSGFNITIASKDNFIKNAQGSIGDPNSSIELNGENASFEIRNFSVLILDQFTLTKGTLTINNGNLNADLNMNGGTFSGTLANLHLNENCFTQRKITFTQGGDLEISGFTLPQTENLDITVKSTSAEGSSRISIQPGATVTLHKGKGNISLGSDLTVTGGTLNIGNNVNLKALHCPIYRIVRSHQSR